MDENNIFFPYKNQVKAKEIKVLRRRCFATYVSKEINGRTSAHFLNSKDQQISFETLEIKNTSYVNFKNK